VRDPVFTHLTNNSIPWLLELHRVLKPGGCVSTGVRHNLLRAQREIEYADAQVAAIRDSYGGS
jgi:hypothetical protein